MDASFNRNPTGKNQYGTVLKASDPRLAEALRKYHRQKIVDNQKISDLLLAEYDIDMSIATIKRRRKELKLLGSRSSSKQVPREEAEQLIINEINSDLAQHAGVRTIQHKVAYNSGVHVARHIVHDVMRAYQPEGFNKREPTAKKIRRHQKIPLGIHERWAGDGHDKLYSIGFPIWAVVDDATGKPLGSWVVPSNRIGFIIAYLFLSLVVTYEGIPLQFSTDHGSETTQLYGLVNALRELFFPDFEDTEVLPAHVYLQSVHNISIERSWLRLRLDFGDNAVLAFQEGAINFEYNEHDPDQYELCRWLWAKLLRQELAKAISLRDGIRVRKQANKVGPSGMSRHEAFTLPEKWGGVNCLLRLSPEQVQVVKDIMVAMGGDELLEFNSAAYRTHAERLYCSLNISQLSFSNVWDVFTAMRRLLEEDPFIVEEDPVIVD